MVDYIRDLRLGKWGSAVSLRGSNSEPLMSALGQKQTSAPVRVMSALPPKADIGNSVWKCPLSATTDSCSAANQQLFNHVVGASEHQWRHVEAQRLGGFEIRALERNHRSRPLAPSVPHR